MRFIRHDVDYLKFTHAHIGDPRNRVVDNNDPLVLDVDTNDS